MVALARKAEALLCHRMELLVKEQDEVLKERVRKRGTFVQRRTHKIFVNFFGPKKLGLDNQNFFRPKKFVFCKKIINISGLEFANIFWGRIRSRINLFFTK